MIKPHLSEEEIQLAVLDPAGCKNELAHLESCSDCAVKAANYRALFAGLSALPEPVIDTHLLLSVMEKLSEERVGARWPDFSIGLVSGLAAAALAALVWLNPQFITLAARGASENMVLLMTFTGVGIAIFYGTLVYKKYKQQMQVLDKL